MKQTKIHLRRIILRLVILLAWMQAVNPTVMAGEPEGSVYLYYAVQAKAAELEGLCLYCIARGGAGEDYQITEDFADLRELLSPEMTREKLTALHSALDLFLSEHEATACAVTGTDRNGRAVFDGLTPGLYLVSGAEGPVGEERYRFDSVLLSLPGPDEEGENSMELTCFPKGEQLQPRQSPEHFTVLKRWMDAGNAAKRPESILVEIYCNAGLYQTVELSEENKWSYSWDSTLTGASWTVKERDVPEGYSCSILRQDRDFYIVNTYGDGDHQVPRTGDSILITLLSLLASLSLLLITILILLRRRTIRNLEEVLTNPKERRNRRETTKETQTV